MADVYFHYSNARSVLIDQSGTAVDDLTEAREHVHRAGTIAHHNAQR